MSVARFVLFAVFMLVALAGINAQVFRWARNAFQLTPRAQGLLKTLLWVSVLGVVLGRVAGRYWPGAVTTSVIAVSSTMQLAAIISGILLMVVDAARLLSGLPGRLQRAFTALRAPVARVEPMPPAPAPAPPQAEVELPRRAFLTQAAAGSAFLIGSSSSLYGALKGRHDYTIEEVPIRLPGLARSMDGFSIVQLSDVHIGVFTGSHELAAAEDLVRRAKPDLIVLTGDLLDNDARLAEQLARWVRRLTPLAREGVVAITGNHDYFAGDAETTLAIRSGGGRMLRNQAELIGGAGGGFALLGVDDVWARRGGGGPDLQQALATLPAAADMPSVLLCHNPSFFDEAAGSVGLQLSGHTHGGQVNLGIRPADYVLPFGWVAGRYDLRGSALYVNRGFGTVGPPARLGAPPEVTRIVLTA